MKRLFQVKADGVNYFESKVEAKKFRDTMNGNTAKATCHVSLGPDHAMFGVKGNRRTHSHNAKSGGPGTGFPKGRR